MKKQIILTADDYGCSDFIDNGVEDAVLDGKINSVACFVSHADSKERIRELLSMKKILQEQNKPTAGFGIGLHFSMTSGKALTGQSSLTDPNDKNSTYFREAFGYDFSDINPQDLQLELIAQLDKMREIMDGEPIDHLSHHHGFVYMHEPLYNIYVDTLKDYNRKHGLDIPMRSPVAWFRRFNAGPADNQDTKSCHHCFDNLDKKLITPAAIEGIKLMMWKKYFQTTYGVMRKRKRVTDDKEIRTPELLCDIIYGQASKDNPDGIRETLKKIFHIYSKDDLLTCGGYAESGFSAEMMFHVGKGELDKADVPHGINEGYFKGRLEELDALKTFDLEAALKHTNTTKSIYADIKR